MFERKHVLILAGWLAVLGGALGGLTVHGLRAGAQKAAPDTWPAGSALPPPRGAPVVLLFAHPKCPCTRASLSELRAMASRFASRVTFRVVFLRPGGVHDDWSRTDTWSDASSFATVVEDAAGHEASLFGAETSGHVVAYDRAGHLLFSGGITPSRGHVGDSLSRRTLATRLESETAGQDETAPHGTRPVFGCPLSRGNDDAP